MNETACLECGERFRDADSVGSVFAKCQPCWERSCSHLWYEMAYSLESSPEARKEADFNDPYS